MGALSLPNKLRFAPSLPVFRKGWSLRLGLLLVLAGIVSGLATYAALTETPPFGNDPDTVFWLINLDLVILLALAALIGRRVAKVWMRRRQNVAGSKLHIRLLATFSVMAAGPAILMAVFSALFFHYGVQAWFSDRVSTAVTASQAVAESYLEEHRQVIRADALAMANDLDRQAGLMIGDAESFQHFIDTQSLLRNFSEAMVFDSSGRLIGRSGLTFTLTFERVPDYQLVQARGGEVVLMTGGVDEDGQENRLRALVHLNNFSDAYLLVGRAVDSTVLAHVAATRDAASVYAQLQGRYGTLQLAMTTIFIVVALLFLLGAIWMGIGLARELVTPIGTLIETSERVRAGDLSARVPEGSSIEEFDYLARSFNRMTGQLKQQRDELIGANRQIDQRRHFIETVLSGVSAGVIGLDEKGTVTLANDAALDIFGEAQDLSGRAMTDLLPGINELLTEAKAKTGKLIQREIPMRQRDGTSRTLLVRAVFDEPQDGQGAVLTFDDISDLQSAQRKAAWADVARRIAHEIKNPLTPIMLSAERLKRKYLKEIQSDPDTFVQMTDTIVRHVGDIGRMVNEFSAFARMPEPVMKPEDLSAQVRETLVMQREAHSDSNIAIDILGADEKRPVVCDSQQIRQALVNLLQNAVDSVQSRMAHASGRGHVRVLLSTLENGDYLVCVTDNGLGLPEGEEIARLTEPYITHKAKGTGLGLAIVKKIMEDHKGRVVIGEPAWLSSVDGWQPLGGTSVSMILPAGANVAAATIKAA